MGAVAAPVIVVEMQTWTNLGGGNSGIVGDQNHSYGFHCSANNTDPDDYSRWRDPNGSDGPYVNWDYACAGDFSHGNDDRLRGYHRNVLARLMNGEMPMICEFIGKPWADRPVYYWARWNGVKKLELYTGSGHDTWSHISWYRSRVNEPAGLWTPGTPTPPGPQLHRQWPGYMGPNDYFGLMSGPDESRGGGNAYERPDVKAIQQRLISMGYVPGISNPNSSWADGVFEQPTYDAVAKWQRHLWAPQTTLYGQVWSDDWARLFTY